MLPVSAKMWTDSVQKRREWNLFPAFVCIRTSGTGRLVCFYPRINNGYKHIKIRLLSNKEEKEEEEEEEKKKKKEEEEEKEKKKEENEKRKEEKRKKEEE